MLKKIIWVILSMGLLVACASSGTGKTQMYGEIKSGVEYTRTHH